MLSFQLERNNDNEEEVEFTLNKLKELNFDITDYKSVVFASIYGTEFSGIITRPACPRSLTLCIFKKINGHDQEIMRIAGTLLGAVYVLS